MFKQKLKDILNYQQQVNDEGDIVNIQYLDTILQFLSINTKYKQLQAINIKNKDVYEYLTINHKVNLNKYQINNQYNLFQVQSDQILIKTSNCQLCKKENALIVIVNQIFLIICNECAIKYLKNSIIYSVRDLLAHPEMQNFIGEKFIQLYYKFLQLNIDSNNQLNTLQLMKQIVREKSSNEQAVGSNQTLSLKTIRLQNNLIYECLNYVPCGLNQFICVNDPMKKDINIYGINDSTGTIKQAIIQNFKHLIQLYEVSNQVNDDLISEYKVQEEPNNLAKYNQIYVIDKNKINNYNINEIYNDIFIIKLEDIFRNVSNTFLIAKTMFSYMEDTIIGFQEEKNISNIKTYLSNIEQDKLQDILDFYYSHNQTNVNNQAHQYFYYTIKDLFNLEGEIKIDKAQIPINEIKQYEIENSFTTQYQQQQLINVTRNEVHILQKQLVQYLKQKEKIDFTQLKQVLDAFSIDLKKFNIDIDQFNSQNVKQLIQKLDEAI